MRFYERQLDYKQIEYLVLKTATDEALMLLMTFLASTSFEQW